jgi:FlaA1/EpsC-like NDP-sugar epimerase
LSIKQVVIALDEVGGMEIRRIMDICSAIPVRAQIVPSLNEIATGRVSVSRIRDVQIEDLLGREPVILDDKNLHDFLTGRTVMVTGAGGSIGSELVRQIINYRPKCLLLVERAEFFLFQIGRELSEIKDVDFVPLIADIGDEPRMRDIFEAYRPEGDLSRRGSQTRAVDGGQRAEAIKNNVLATRSLGTLAGSTGARLCSHLD